MISKETQNLSSFIYQDLHKKIEEFIYKPGDQISEPKLAKLYGVSRTPIKQALGRLETEGIVYVKSNIGTFISKINTNNLKEFFTLRKLLEIAIYEEFKNTYSDESVHFLEENLSKQRKLLDNYTDINKVESSKQFWYLDNEFHQIIFKTVNKEFLWEHILHQSLQANRFRVLSVSLHSEDLEIRVKEHQEIFDYLINNVNTDINELYNDHLFTTLDSNIKELKEQFPEYFI